MLIGQYLELRKPASEQLPNYVGLICEATSPAELARQAAEDARYMCEREFGDAPGVSVRGTTDKTFAYVPSHMYYMLFELLKNSMRAVVEHHMDGGGAFPDVRVVIADGETNEDVVVKISDEGGGIKRSHIQHCFSYLFTTAGNQAQDQLAGGSSAEAHDFDRDSPLAGLGYGLPISRTYARYFGGDLELHSLEGHGTDAYVHLSRLVDNDEPLP